MWPRAWCDLAALPSILPLPPAALSLLAPDQVLQVLSKVDDWKFDAFDLEEASGGWPLSTLTFALFTKLRLTHSRWVSACTRVVSHPSTSSLILVHVMG